MGGFKDNVLGLSFCSCNSATGVSSSGTGGSSDGLVGSSWVGSIVVNTFGSSTPVPKAPAYKVSTNKPSSSNSVISVLTF